MKDLRFQIKGLVGKANNLEDPNDAGKTVPAQTKAEASQNGDGGSTNLSINAGPKALSLNPLNRKSEQPRIDVGQLIVGSGVTLKGNIECCKTLEIHGEVEA